MLIFSSCPKGITRLFLGRRTPNTRASSVFRSDGRPPRDHPFTRPLGPRDLARGSPEPGEAGWPAVIMDPGSSFQWSTPARGRREGGSGGGSQLRNKNAERAEPSRVQAADVSAAEEEGGRRSADRALFRRNSCRGRAWRGCSAFSRPPPSAAIPPEYVAASRRSLPGGRCQARCASTPMASARTDRRCGEHL